MENKSKIYVIFQTMVVEKLHCYMKTQILSFLFILKERQENIINMMVLNLFQLVKKEIKKKYDCVIS